MVLPLLSGIEPLIAAAERLLSDALGGRVLLAGPDSLGGSNRSTVVRCNVINSIESAPESVIIKCAEGDEDQPYDPENDRHPRPAWRFFNEWAGLQFLGNVIGFPHSPRFYGGDRTFGFIVMEDVGSGESVLDLLYGSDPARAEAALVDLAATLGRMHAATVGRASEFACLRAALGQYDPENWSYGAMDTIPESVARLRKAAQAIGLELPSALDSEVETVTEASRKPSPFLAYTHGDPCPINARLIDGNMRLFDFEFGMFRHALLDGVYGRVPFPTDIGVHRLPPHLPIRMEVAYRAELAKGCPEASDDGLFHKSVAETCGYWLIWTIGLDLPYALDDNAESVLVLRQRILARLAGFAALVQECGHLRGLGEASHDIAMRLRTRWPADAEAMPLYPAFRHDQAEGSR